MTIAFILVAILLYVTIGRIVANAANVTFYLSWGRDMPPKDYARVWMLWPRTVISVLFDRE